MIECCQQDNFIEEGGESSRKCGDQLGKLLEGVWKEREKVGPAVYKETRNVDQLGKKEKLRGNYFFKCPTCWGKERAGAECLKGGHISLTPGAALTQLGKK